jgi:transposase
MSTRVKQRAVIEFLTAEKVTPTEIHRRLKAVYRDDAVDRSTVNRWVIKFRGCEPGKAIIVETRSGRPITATDDNHRKLVDDLIQDDLRITQKRIANHIGISKIKKLRKLSPMLRSGSKLPRVGATRKNCAISDRSSNELLRPEVQMRGNNVPYHQLRKSLLISMT